MIVVITKYKVTEGNVDKVLGFAAASRAYAMTCRGNLEYCAAAYPESNTIISVEKWECKEDLIDYCATEACKTFVESRAPYLVEGSKTTDILEAVATSL